MNIIEAFKRALKETLRYSNKTYAGALRRHISGEALSISDVSPLMNEMTVKVSGVDDISAVKVKQLNKNLLPYPYYSATKTVNGITFTDNGDGTITADGTATANVEFILANISPYLVIDNMGDITFSGCPSGGSANTYYLTCTSTGHKDIGNGYSMSSFLGKYFRFKIVIASGKKVENIVFKPQVEFGKIATEYEPYVQPIEYPVNADGTIDGVTSIYPTTTLITDTAGAVIDCEYNQDTNKAIMDTDELDERYFVKHTYSTSYRTLPALDEKGGQIRMSTTSSPFEGMLVMFDKGGRLKTNEPTTDLHCANKKYVDDNCGWKLVQEKFKLDSNRFYMTDSGTTLAVVFSWNSDMSRAVAILPSGHSLTGGNSCYSNQFYLSTKEWCYLYVSDGTAYIYDKMGDWIYIDPDNDDIYVTIYSL